MGRGLQQIDAILSSIFFNGDGHLHGNPGLCEGLFLLGSSLRAACGALTARPRSAA